MRKSTAKDRLCVALDVDDARTALKLAKRLSSAVGLFKIGLELFTSEGPRAVQSLTKLGLRVFLDLKIHDIPNTAAGAARAATRLGVAMFNVHASGGSEMIRASVEAASDEAAKLGVPCPLVLAVTVLTSIDEVVIKRDLLIRRPLKEVVRKYAEMAQAAGADGVVASPQEIVEIRNSCGPDFCIVTPGVRPRGASAGDQKRIATPSEALGLGSNYVVIGRPIIAAPNPLQAATQVLQELTNAAQ